MSLFYRIACFLGVTPWEGGLAQPAVARQLAAMFDCEEAGREAPYGRVLDVGCGSGIHAVELARRGWQVVGIDAVPRAIERARERARAQGVSVDFRVGDVTDLAALRLEPGFRLFLDFGTVHGLTPEQCLAVGRSVTALAAPEATLLMIAFAPGRRAPLPRGLDRAEIERIYPGWTITDELAQDAELPWFLEKVGAAPRWYRLRRG